MILKTVVTGGDLHPQRKAIEKHCSRGAGIMLYTEGDHNMLLSTRLLWYKDYFELKTTETEQMQK